MKQIFVKPPSKILLHSCCCCIDVRVGCMILAIIGIFVNCGFFGTKYQNCNALGDCNDTFKVLASGSTFGIMGSLCLIFGVLKSNIAAVSFSLIAELIRMLLYFAFAIMSFVNFSDCNSSNPILTNVFCNTETCCNLHLVGGIFGILSIIAWIYPWLVAFSLFQKMREKEPSNECFSIDASMDD